jgi:hypothetical protein
MTTAHLNRTIQQLRVEGLIEVRNREISILDPKRLREAARYETNYLHLIRTEQRDGEVSGRAGDLVAPSDRD